MDKNNIKNTLQVYLEEVFRLAQDRKLIIVGCKRIAVFYACAIRALGRDVAYFIDTEAADGAQAPERCFLGRPLHPIHRLLYEDPAEIAVILSTHSRRELIAQLESFGLAENESIFNMHGYQSVREYDLFDPLTGYARSEDRGLFRMHGTDGENVLRIAAVGGATTDHCYSELRSWPDFLHEILERRGIPNVIFNGGLNGFTSCEERDIVLRDVPCLRPDLVISLSGECDIGYIMTSRDYPWYSRYSAGKFSSILRAHKPDGMKLWFDETADSAGTSRPDSENWLNNERIMHASLKPLGIRFFGFLQPIIFGGQYQMSEFEKRCMERFMTEGAEAIPSIGQIFTEGTRFYHEIRDKMEEYDFLYDLSGVFDHVSGVYSDGVHYDEEGNRLIAQAIADVLVQQGAVKWSGAA